MIKKYRYHTGRLKDSHLNEFLYDIDQRLNELEFKSSKNGKKPEVSRAEKMLLMHHLGLLDKLRELNISNVKIAKLIQLLINASPDNIEGDLSDLNNPKSALKNEKNYSFLVKAFKDIGLNEKQKNAEAILDKIKNKNSSK